MPDAAAHIAAFITFSHHINLYCFNYLGLWPDVKGGTGGHQIPWDQQDQKEQNFQPLKVPRFLHISQSYRENGRVSLLSRQAFKSSPFSVMHQSLFFLFCFPSKTSVLSPLSHFLLLHCLPTSSLYHWYSSNKYHAKDFLIPLSLNLSPFSSIHFGDIFQAKI